MLWFKSLTINAFTFYSHLLSIIWINAELLLTVVVFSADNIYYRGSINLSNLFLGMNGKRLRVSEWVNDFWTLALLCDAFFFPRFAVAMTCEAHDFWLLDAVITNHHHLNPFHFFFFFFLNLNDCHLIRISGIQLLLLKIIFCFCTLPIPRMKKNLNCVAVLSEFRSMGSCCAECLFFFLLLLYILFSLRIPCRIPPSKFLSCKKCFFERLALCLAIIFVLLATLSNVLYWLSRRGSTEEGDQWGISKVRRATQFASALFQAKWNKHGSFASLLTTSCRSFYQLVRKSRLSRNSNRAPYFCGI